jgi:cohesin loading factor subunit SCC2
MDQQDDMLSGMENSNVSENDIPFNVQYPGQTSKTPITPQDVNRPLNAAQCLSQQEQTAFLPANQVPVLQQNTSVATKQPQTSVVQNQQQVSQQGPIYDEVELDALAEIERIERESAIERERFSKEVQDKGKGPLSLLLQHLATCVLIPTSLLRYEFHSLAEASISDLIIQYHRLSNLNYITLFELLY